MPRESFEKAVRSFKAAISIEWLVRGRLYGVLLVSTAVYILAVASVLLAVGVLQLVQTGQVHFAALTHGRPYLVGGALLAAALFIHLKLLRFYFNTKYFIGLDTIIDGTTATDGTVYEVAKILTRSPHDVTRGFIMSPFGHRFMLRCGLDTEVTQKYLQSDRNALTWLQLSEAEGQLTLRALAVLLKDTDLSFATMLRTAGVSDDVFMGALLWTYRDHLQHKRQARWWSKDNLSKTSGLGREFTYGVAYTLNKFTKPVADGAIYANHAIDQQFAAPYVEEVETILARDNNANVLLVGPAGVGKLDILVAVGHRMEVGQSINAIKSKHVILLDTELLIATAGDKALFEQTFLLLLSQAAHAGNIILIIDKLPAFMQNASTYGIDVTALLERYLDSPELQIIGTAEPRVYHDEIETRGQLLRRFATVQVTAPEVTAVVELLEVAATNFETRTRVRFSYPAIAQIAESADRHIVDGEMPDKAIQLFEEVATAARKQGERFVTQAAVEALIAEKTGIPVGPLADTERDQLLHLESLLHERIVGQEKAVAAISGVMRRSRAGIQDSEKPIGTFLFLGPTGVGKTESAKTLATVFFSGEDAMHRLDMSEFSGFDALDRLIGGNGHTGVLSNMLKEEPYAVLLLDEFEKASSAVHDLFLQILDEGIFTDGLNRRINVRNSIIIATSNAGSDTILQWVEAGESLADKTPALVDRIIADRVFKPELVNRFDAVVLFSPLTQAEQGAVARLMLNDLKARIKEKGYELVVTDELINVLADIGYQPEFGARPMRRAIQEVVEEAIATKLIAGNIQKGDTITFTPEELAAMRQQL